MNANGLYSGLDGGAVNGVYNGVNSGVGNGAVSNETKQLDIPILDRFPGAAAAYSLRKLRTQYSGPAIRVRRSSDNTEQDIGFDTSGKLNEIQLRLFIGSNDAFITIWYDQMNNYNVNQTTQSLQPRIALGGVIDRLNGLPTIYTPRGRNLQSAVSILLSDMSYFGVINIESIATSSDAIISLQVAGSTNQYRAIATATVNSLALISRTSAGNFYAQSLISTGTSYIFSGFWRSDSDREIFTNGGNSGTNTSTSAGFTATKLLIFKTRDTDPSGTNEYRGYCSELIFFNSNENNNKYSIEKNINNYYKIY
jgi:hypothetical protein